jgi:hypothetical protein
MQIIAHRGFWSKASEKNTSEAFERALSHGFGIETDFRDSHGRLVIAHDLPTGNEMLASDFLALCKRFPQSGIHAFNVKADGLQMEFMDLLAERRKDSYFLFDMSVPDTLGYFKVDLPVYIRMSEYEDNQSLISKGTGIWLDAFVSEWYTVDLIINLLVAGKEVALVSPELHGRPHPDCWKSLKNAKVHQYPGFSICTDYPLMAKEYFQ